MDSLFFDIDAIVADIVDEQDRDDMTLQVELDMLDLDDDEGDEPDDD